MQKIINFIQRIDFKKIINILRIAWIFLTGMLVRADVFVYLNMVKTGRVDLNLFFFLVCIHICYFAVSYRFIFLKKNKSNAERIRQFMIYAFVALVFHGVIFNEIRSAVFYVCVALLVAFIVYQKILESEKASKK